MLSSLPIILHYPQKTLLVSLYVQPKIEGTPRAL